MLHTYMIRRDEINPLHAITFVWATICILIIVIICVLIVIAVLFAFYFFKSVGEIGNSSYCQKCGKLLDDKKCSRCKIQWV